MTLRFHVTSSRNRASIEQHGLDWTRMGAARGIAGSHRPEAEGIFLVDHRFDVVFFAGMNNTGGPVDVWEVAGVGDDELLDNGNGFFYVPRRIARRDLALRARDIPPRPFGSARMGRLDEFWDDAAHARGGLSAG
ncbi:MAG: hypothetical protein ACTHMS_15550 [Jatrophihabitans sp.]|uniref:hypothetical protein n=1 Tax=Jatrophihabitans sp. TaxID=1932789 RepID=UPI003F7F3944